MTSYIQSILFSRKIWSLPKARSFLMWHNFQYQKVDKTKKYYRFRQKDPKKFKRLRTKKAFEDGVSVIFGFI